MPVPCARCSMPLPRWGLDTSAETACPSCGAGNMVRAFPAMFAERAAAAPEAALTGEAACLDHPGKRAAGAGLARIANPDAARTLYDSIALTLPLASLILMWPTTIAAAPAALVLS